MKQTPTHAGFLIVAIAAVLAGALQSAVLPAQTGETLVTNEMATEAASSDASSTSEDVEALEDLTSSSLSSFPSSEEIILASSSSDSLVPTELSSASAGASSSSSSSEELSSSSIESSASSSIEAMEQDEVIEGIEDSSESSASSESSRDRLAELRARLSENDDDAAPAQNIAPSFIIPQHQDIADAEELQRRVTLSLVNIAGDTTDVDFIVDDEDPSDSSAEAGGGYRVTIVPPRTFVPARYRLIASLDRTRGVSRVLQRFFRNTDETTDKDDAILLDEYIDWGTVTTNVEDSEDSEDPEDSEDSEEGELIMVKRESASQIKPGESETMTITVTADVDMTGTIRETVSKEFQIASVTPAGSIDTVGDETVIEWSVAFVRGESRTFSYTYTAPEDDPLFALFGPVEVRGVPEATQDSENPEDSEAPEEEMSSSSFSSVDSSASSASSFFGTTSSRAESDASFESSSGSSEASESSESSVTEESIEASSDSPLSAFFQTILAAIVIDEDEILFAEDFQWQLLVTDKEFVETDRERSLVLERTAAVFDANSKPSFTLIDTELGTDDRMLNGSGNLLENVALQEILRTIVSDEDVKNAVVAQILSGESERITEEALQDRDNQQALQDATGETSGTALERSVQSIIEDTAEARDGLSAIVSGNEIADDIVDQIMTDTLHDTIIDDIADAGLDPVSISDVVDDAIAVESEDMTVLKEAVVQTVLNDVSTAGVIAEAADAAAETPAEETTLMKVNLTAPDGTIIEDVPFHFEVGSVELVIDPVSAFRPGLYTVEVLVTNPLTGETTTMYQQFAWGVLALNADKDRYAAGETAAIDIGVLDDRGEIVCTADLDLQITNPDGSIEQLSTDDDSIETTGSCGKKEAGFIDPDFTTSFLFDQTGAYELVLTAETPNGIRSITSEIIVESSPQFTVKRTGATRLWPFAPSPMTIDVSFGSDVNGMISERIPAGFEIVETEPEAEILTLDDGTTFIRWSGNWQAGNTETFTYIYDAPDISPQFYLLGPVRILSDTPPPQQ